MIDSMSETLTFTVTTVAGSRQHVVSGMQSNLIVATILGQAYRGEKPGFFLPSPPTFYTLANVISVSFEGGVPEVVEQIERTIGFPTNIDEEE